ncbi:MAG: GNAT family N-acetyltransferase [Pseudomonadota bacterium]
MSDPDWELLHPVPEAWQGAVGRYAASTRRSLQFIVGDEETRAALLGAPIRPDRIAAIIRGGEVVGFLSYRMEGAGALCPQVARYRARFGHVSGTLRWLLTQATLVRGRAEDLYIEGFAVDPAARGLGLGQVLLGWLGQEVIRRGKAGWRTEMPADQPAAARTYEKAGAVCLKTLDFGPAGRLIGWRRARLYRWTPGARDPI